MTEFLLQSSWWIPLYGLFGAILTLPWSTGIVRRTGPRPAAYLNVLMTVVSLAHGLAVFRLVWNQPPQQVMLHWLQVADLDLSFALELSPVSAGAIVLATGLSLLAQIYALGYLEKDWGIARFYALMGFFESAMSGLVLSDSLLLSYGLLEILTLSTYLLVGFWYAQPLVITAARDAFLTKRVGDILLLMGVVSLATITGSINFSDYEQWAQTAQLEPVPATLLGLALIAGPAGKCAQFPLHLWLDEAMEGPNPASILRNSLVVSCGAYVLIKLQPVIAILPAAQTSLIVMGGMTAIGASLVAIAQLDIKRALSHSTSAYLGLVFIAVGLQQTDVALLLLLTHGVAKALLFMGVGSVIMTTSTQNLTEMGGLASRMPVTTLAFGIGTLGMVGLLPLGNFWAFLNWMDGLQGIPIWLIGILIAVNSLTAMNLVRVCGRILMGKPQPKTRRAPEVPWPMAVPMVSMIVITLLIPVMLSNWGLLPSLSEINPVAATLLIGSSLVGGGLGVLFYRRSLALPTVWKPVHDLLAYDFYIDRLYRLTVVLGVSFFSRLTAWIDQYVVDGAVNLVGLASLLSGEGLKYSISGRSQAYVLTILVGVGALGLWMTWPLLAVLNFGW